MNVPLVFFSGVAFKCPKQWRSGAEVRCPVWALDQLPHMEEAALSTESCLSASGQDPGSLRRANRVQLNKLALVEVVAEHLNLKDDTIVGWFDSEVDDAAREQGLAALASEAIPENAIALRSLQPGFQKSSSKGYFGSDLCSPPTVSSSVMIGRFSTFKQVAKEFDRMLQSPLCLEEPSGTLLCAREMTEELSGKVCGCFDDTSILTRMVKNYPEWFVDLSLIS